MADAVVSLHRIADLPDGDRVALRALSEAVYPPAEWADWPGNHLEWAAAEWCVRVWGGDGKLVSYIGIVLRPASYDGQPVLVGGIGGVKTHPAARGRGHAGQGIRRAVEFFRAQPSVAFGLLVCTPQLIGYYALLGWQEFGGRLLVTQHGTVADFTFNQVMVQEVRSAAPSVGTIDLMGPPW
jgi:hypothetical protein